jgi:hypothetical protein
MARTLGSFGRVEGLQLHVQHGRQLGQGLQHLVGRGRVGIVDVQHGDVRDVEAQRLVVEPGVQELLPQQPADRPREKVVDLRRQRVDEAEGALVLAEGRRAQGAVVDRALCGSGVDIEHGHAANGDRGRPPDQFDVHATPPRNRYA